MNTAEALLTLLGEERIRRESVERHAAEEVAALKQRIAELEAAQQEQSR